MVDNDILTSLGFLLAEIPVLLVWTAGLVIAVVRWRQHPRVSLLTVIALILMLVNLLVGMLLNILIPTWLSAQGSDSSEIILFFTVKGFIQAVISAVAFGLLLAALFGWRKPAVQPVDLPAAEPPDGEIPFLFMK